MVSLDDAVIARLKKGEEHFEILVDPYEAASLIDGNEIDIIQDYGTEKGLSNLRKKYGHQTVLLYLSGIMPIYVLMTI